MTTTRVALIGTGAIAREHIAAIKKLRDVELSAICDLSEARVRYIGERYGLERTYVDWRRMLAEVRPHWVNITTPPNTHFEIAKGCLEAGCHVLCEKPIALRVSDFVQLRDIAKERQLHLLENQNLRCHSSIVRIKRMIESGEFGEVVDVNISLSLDVYSAGNPYTDEKIPHFSRVLRGGVIGDFLPHMTYLCAMFTGPVEKVETTWLKRRRNSILPHDEFRALVTGGRATAYLSFTGNGQPAGFWIRVWGTKQYVEVNLYESPRLQRRKVRTAPAPLPSLLNGLSEAASITYGTLASVAGKLGGKSAYDGLLEYLGQIYSSSAAGIALPLSSAELEENVMLLDRLSPQDAAA